MKLVDKIKLIWAAITGNVAKGAEVLSKHAGELTAVATTIEAMTGNEDLIPLTQKAGQAAQSIGTAIDNGQDALTAIAEQVESVATSEGSDSVAKIAKKVSKVTKKVNDTLT